MARSARISVPNQLARNSDKLVWKLDAFPELLKGLRDGDLRAARLVCARLFDGDGPRGYNVSTPLHFARR